MSDNIRNIDDDSKDEDSKSIESGSKRKIYMKRKVCRFCADKSLKLNYKEIDIIRRFTKGLFFI